MAESRSRSWPRGQARNSACPEERNWAPHPKLACLVATDCGPPPTWTRPPNSPQTTRRSDCGKRDVQVGGTGSIQQTRRMHHPERCRGVRNSPLPSSSSATDALRQRCGGPLSAHGALVGGMAAAAKEPCAGAAGRAHGAAVDAPAAVGRALGVAAQGAFVAGAAVRGGGGALDEGCEDQGAAVADEVCGVASGAQGARVPSCEGAEAGVALGWG